MALPKQVQQQLDEAEQIEKQLLENKDGEKAAPAPNSPRVVTPEAEQNLDAPAKQAEPAPEPEPKKEPESEPEPQSKQDKPAGQDDDPAYWKQKYSTLKGMFDAEVPRLNTQNKELEKAIETLTSEMAEVKQEKKQAEYAANQSLVTDEDRKEFGEDLLEVQRKVAREVAAEFQPRLDKLEEENTKLREQLDGNSAAMTEMSFDTRLRQVIPDFDAVNHSQEWLGWLNEVDPMLRGPRKTAAMQAFNSGDVEGVKHFVDLFKASQKPVATDGAQSRKESSLESQIQPSNDAASPAPEAVSPQGKTYTDADVREMFQRVMRLNSAGRTEEAQTLEAEIDAAYAQQRVVAG